MSNNLTSVPSVINKILNEKIGEKQVQQQIYHGQTKE